MPSRIWKGLAMLVFQTNHVGVKGSSQTTRLIRQPEVCDFEY